VSAFVASAASGRTFTSRNPATGAPVGDVPDCSASDMIAAADAADAAFPGWSKTPAAARGRLVRRAGELISERAAELAALITAEQGKPLGEARFEVMLAAEAMFWFAEEGRRAYGQSIPDPMPGRRLVTIKQPAGVVAAITPWNIPLLALPRKVAAAICAGCTVVLKPAEQTSLVALAFAGLLAEAGLPPGVVNVVTTADPGPAVAALLADPRVRKLSFTGSTPIGRSLLHHSAERVVNTSLELGGNAPFLVLDDADLDAAVEGAMIAKMRNGGQACTAANRFLVHPSVADDFAARLGARMAALRVGPGTDEATELGPMINARRQRDLANRVEAALDDGAKVHTGGSPLAGPGFFYPATVLSGVDRDGVLSVEETFGPIAPIIEVADDDDAVALANTTEYGLAAYVYSRDLGRALSVAERLQAGMVGVNRGAISDPAAPFGGMKQSGLGREGGFDGIHEYLEVSYLAVDW
jgi:succinate-semialdehyde dehydrogenase/glutarate-semialdehyde dehydrogenase